MSNDNGRERARRAAKQAFQAAREMLIAAGRLAEHGEPTCVRVATVAIGIADLLSDGFIDKQFRSASQGWGSTGAWRASIVGIHTIEEAGL